MSVTEEKVCRCCLEQGSHMKWYPLCGQILNVEMELKDMLEFCTKTEVNLEDDLPNKICEMCFKLLRMAYNFLYKFQEAEKVFKQNKYVIEELKIEIIDPDHNYYETVDTSEIEVECITTDCLSFEDSEFTKVEDTVEDPVVIPHIEENNDTATNTKQCEKITSSHKFVMSNEDKKETNEETKKRNVSRIESLEFSKLILYKCPMCDVKKKFVKTFRGHLIQHCSNHFTCPYCVNNNDEYTVESYIKHYEIFHKFQCPTCSKVLGGTHNLMYHMKRHKAEKPFVCPVEGCVKRFCFSYELKRHSDVHSAEKKFQCKLCDANFYTYDTLRYHQITHNGQKDFLCMFCGKSYFMSCHLKSHIMSNHSNNRLKCKYCSASYRSKTGLRKHHTVCSKKT